MAKDRIALDARASGALQLIGLWNLRTVLPVQTFRCFLELSYAPSRFRH